LSIDIRKQLYTASSEDAVLHEWDGLYAVFCIKDESTHFLDPIGSLIFERLRASSLPLSIDNLVSSVLDECDEDVDVTDIARLTEEHLLQLQRIGLVSQS